MRRSSRAVPAALATNVTPLVSRSSRFTSCGCEPGPRCKRARLIRLEYSSPLVGWQTRPAGLLITSSSPSSYMILNSSSTVRDAGQIMAGKALGAIFISHVARAWGGPDGLCAVSYTPARLVAGTGPAADNRLARQSKKTQPVQTAPNCGHGG